jgi:hypothetical protein
VQREGDLFQFVGTGHAPCGFTCGLNRREEQGDEYSNDRDNDQKLDQSERTNRALTDRRRKISVMHD